MKHKIARQWLIYICCIFTILFISIYEHYSSPDHKNIGMEILFSPLSGLILYMLIIPIQLTMWAFKKIGFIFPVVKKDIHKSFHLN